MGQDIQEGLKLNPLKYDAHKKLSFYIYIYIYICVYNYK